jgi:hypothetical protein
MRQRGTYSGGLSRGSPTHIHTTANGLIPSQSLIQSGSAPEPTVSFDFHSPKMPNCLDIWHRGSMNGPGNPIHLASGQFRNHKSVKQL